MISFHESGLFPHNLTARAILYHNSPPFHCTRGVRIKPRIQVCGSAILRNMEHVALKPHVRSRRRLALLPGDPRTPDYTQTGSLPVRTKIGNFDPESRTLVRTKLAIFVVGEFAESGQNWLISW